MSRSTLLVAYVNRQFASGDRIVHHGNMLLAIYSYVLLQLH
ncbi:hypothetical protein [Pseudomonas glycinae]|nr:hypothetical protein [Pseudomonas glycinae]